jgi:hypothetical protein
MRPPSANTSRDAPHPEAKEAEEAGPRPQKKLNTSVILVSLMVLLPLSCFGAHTIRSDLNLFGTLRVYSDITTVRDYRNRWGLLAINDINATGPVSIVKQNGTGTVGLNYDSTLKLTEAGELSTALRSADPLQIEPSSEGEVMKLSHDNTLQVTPQGALSVVPKILMQSELDMRAKMPLKLILDPDVTPGDPIGSEVVLDYSEDDFNISEEGKLSVVPLNITAQGAIRVRRADWTLGEDDTKLRVIGLDVSEDFQQTGGILALRSPGPGRVPFYQLGSGFASNGQFLFDGATTLSVPFIKLTESFVLAPNYAASIGFVHYAYQAGVETGLDILEPINNRRIIKVRTDPSSLHVEDTTNNLAVKIDPSGALKKDISLGLDLKIDASGSIKLDPGLGIDVRLDPAGSIRNTAGVGLSVATDPSGVVFKDVPGLDIRVDEVSIQKTLGQLRVNLSETDRGLQQLPDGLGVRTQTGDPIKSGLDGLYLQLSPNDACLAKTTTGLEVMVAPDSPLRKELLGLDIAVDGVTIQKSLTGLVCGLRGDVVDGDITVTPAGIILCNITAGQGLQKLGTVISALPNTELEEKVDQATDAANQAKGAADAAADTASQAAKTAGDLADKLGDLSSVVDGIGDLGRTIGISVGTSLLTSAATTTAISAAALGLATSQAQALVASKVGAATGIAAVFSGLFGGIGGAIAGALGKKGNTVNHISNTTYNIGVIKEKDSDDEQEDTYYTGFSIGCGTEYSVDLYPDRALNPCTIMPLLGSGLLPVESTNWRTGMLTVCGGLGVSGNIHAGKDVWANGKRLATEDFLSAQLVQYAKQTWVTGQGYITSSALTPYLLASTASSTYQPLITAGAGLSKSGNTISLVGDAVLSSLDVGSGMFSATRKSWVQPTLTNMNGNTFSASSEYSADFGVKAVFDDRQVDRWLSAGNYLNALPKPGVTVTNLSDGSTLLGEWVQINSSRPVIVDFYQMRSSSYIVGRSPQSWAVLGSNDGALWTSIESKSGIVWQSTLQYKSWSITTTAKYAYIRLVFTSLQSTSESILSLNRLQLSGYYEELNSRSNTFTWNGLNVATTADINTAITPLASKSYVDTNVSALQTAINGKQASGDYTTTSALSQALVPYSTTTQMNSAITTSLTPYSTTTQMNSAITNALVPYSTTTQMNSAITTSLTPYSTTTQMNSAITNALVPYSTTTSMNTAISNALSPYLRITDAVSTYTVTAGSGLNKSGNVMSLVPDAALNTLDVGSGMFSAKRVSWNEPTMTTNSQNGYIVSSSSIFASNYDTWNAFSKQGGSWYSADGRYSSTAPYSYIGSNITVANGVSYAGEWLQFKGIVPVCLSSYTLDASATVTTPVSFVLLGSKDSITWTLLDTQTDLTWAGITRKTFNVSVSTSYLYYRIVCQRSLATYVGFGEFKMNGYFEEVKSRSDTFTWNNDIIATQPYVTEALSPYVTSSSLTSSLSSYVTNASLSTTLGSYVLTSTLASYLTTATASSTYQTILTVGAGLTKTTNTISLSPDVSVSSISAAGFSTNNVAWTEPNMTSLTNGVYTVSASSINASTYAAWRPLDSFESYEWLSAANYFNTTPSPTLSASTTVSGTAIRGEWWQLQVPVPTMITLYSIKAHAASLPTRAPTQWLFCGSLDGSTWDQIDSQAGQSSWTSTNLTLTFNISQSKPYSYFRFIFQKTSGTYDTMVAVKRIRFIGFQANLKWYTSRIPTVDDLSQKANTISVTSPLTLSNNIIGIDLSSFLTSATAASTYQAIVTAGTGLTKAGNTISLDSSALSPYLTTATAASTYQPILTAGTGLTKAGNTISLDSSALSPYLTTATAASTYQPIISGGTNLTVNEILTNGKATIGSTLWVNTIYSNIGKTTLGTQVYISNGGANNYNWNSLASTTGGALEVEGSSVFHSPVLISGKNRIANPTGGSFRWFSYDNTGTSSTQGTNPYGFILGQNTYMLGAAGSMIHMYSDRRVKKDIVTLDGEKALDIVKKQRAVSFKYKDAHDKRFGMIAQECIEQELLRDLVSVAKMGDEEERFVMNNQDTVFILWEAVRELAREVQELKARKDCMGRIKQET